MPVPHKRRESSSGLVSAGGGNSSSPRFLARFQDWVLAEYPDEFKILNVKGQKNSYPEDLPSFTPNEHKNNLEKSLYSEFDWGTILQFEKHRLFIYSRKGVGSFEWLRRATFRSIMGNDDSGQLEIEWGKNNGIKPKHPTPSVKTEDASDSIASSNNCSTSGDELLRGRMLAKYKSWSGNLLLDNFKITLELIFASLKGSLIGNQRLVLSVLEDGKHQIEEAIQSIQEDLKQNTVDLSEFEFRLDPSDTKCHWAKSKSKQKALLDDEES